MAVYYTGGGGGLLSTIGKALGIGASLIPGLQPFAPYIAGAAALANGDVGGALGNVAGGVVGNVFNRGPAPNGTLEDALRGAYRDRMPDLYAEPVNGTVGGAPAVNPALQAALASGTQNEMAGIPAQDSFMSAWRRNQGMPHWQSDPVTGNMNPWQYTRNRWR